jgi:hypothetical protein
MKFLLPVVCIIFFTLTGGVSFQHNYRSREAVVQAMKKYDDLILKMDEDSIAMLYTPDGSLGNIARGRDSIRNFLKKFINFKVIYQSSVPDSFYIHADTAVLKGSYHQKTIVAPNDTVSVSGRFNSIWVWLNGGGWHVKNMDTTPGTQ